MGHKLKDQDARVEYATQRMDIALKRTISFKEGEDWASAWRSATAWGIAARTYGRGEPETGDNSTK